MSDTATPISAAPISAALSGHPSDPLISAAIAFLVPMFLWAGDIALARAAAIETLNAYRITSHHAGMPSLSDDIRRGTAIRRCGQ
jgi:hypothetical protein